MIIQTWSEWFRDKRRKCVFILYTLVDRWIYCRLYRQRIGRDFNATVLALTCIGTASHHQSRTHRRFTYTHNNNIITHSRLVCVSVVRNVWNIIARPPDDCMTNDLDVCGVQHKYDGNRSKYNNSIKSIFIFRIIIIIYFFRAAVNVLLFFIYLFVSLLQ